MIRILLLVIALSCVGFQVGDIITVVNKDDAGWWEGELNGQKGLFPRSANSTRLTRGCSESGSARASKKTAARYNRMLIILLESVSLHSNYVEAVSESAQSPTALPPPVPKSASAGPPAVAGNGNAGRSAANGGGPPAQPVVAKFQLPNGGAEQKDSTTKSTTAATGSSTTAAAPRPEKLREAKTKFGQHKTSNQYSWIRSLTAC